MAQRRHVGPRARRAARHLGLVGATSAVTALVVAVVVAGAAGGISQWGASGFSLERAAADGASDDPVARPDAAAGGEAASDGEEGPTERAGAQEKVPVARYVVHVDGAVRDPGVIELSGADVRVRDAVDAAGGLLEDADTSSVNLAEALRDGAKIHIPHVGDATGPAPSPPAGQQSTGGVAGAGDTAALVNLNTATSEELQTLTGVGEVTARAIIEDRTANGPFMSPEDLMRVSGIGEKKFQRIQGSICV